MEAELSQHVRIRRVPSEAVSLGSIRIVGSRSHSNPHGPATILELLNGQRGANVTVKPVGGWIGFSRTRGELEICLTRYSGCVKDRAMETRVNQRLCDNRAIVWRRNDERALCSVLSGLSCNRSMSYRSRCLLGSRFPMRKGHYGFTTPPHSSFFRNLNCRRDPPATTG